MTAWNRNASRITLISILCFLLPVAHAQNLVPNGDFNAPIVPPSWTSTNTMGCGAPTCTFAPDNVNGHPTVPSAKLISTLPGNSGVILVSQCIAYGSSVYDMGAFMRDNGSHVNAQGSVGAFFWSGATCDSGFLEQAPMILLGTVGTWQQFGLNAYDPPGTSGFVIFVLQSRLNGAQAGTANYSFDHVYFNVPDPIFKNDFET